MNILWLSHLVPYPPHAGVAQRSYGLLKELCKRHNVTLLAFHQHDLMKIMSHDPERELQSSVAHLKSLCSEVEVFDIPHDRSSINRYALAMSSLVRKDPYTINWLESGPFANAIGRQSHLKHDLVHFDTISLARYRQAFADTCCVMNHHNIESHLLLRRASKTRSIFARGYYWQEGTRLARYERRTANEFRLHLTCSDLDTKRLEKTSPGLPISVVPNGVDTGFFDVANKQAPTPSFVFVGTLGWGPNRDAAETIVRDLWPAIAKRWPDATFHLIGSKPPESAQALGRADDRFTVTGFVDDVRPYIAEASFFLCPIRDGGGTKLKILNAMSMGSVVVADPIACEGINAATDVELIMATTMEEYVSAIDNLLVDPGKYQRIASAARNRIEDEYSYEVIGRGLDELYQSLVGPSPA